MAVGAFALCDVHGLRLPMPAIQRFGRVYYIQLPQQLALIGALYRTRGWHRRGGGLHSPVRSSVAEGRSQRVSLFHSRGTRTILGGRLFSDRLGDVRSAEKIEALASNFFGN